MIKSKEQENTIDTIIKDLLKSLRLYRRNQVYCEGLTLTQFSILDILINKEEATELKDIHSHLFVEKSTTTRLIYPLIRQKMVIKEISPRDNRAICVRITKKGREAWTNFWNCIKAPLEELWNSLPQKGHDHFLSINSTLIGIISHLCGSNEC